MNLLIVEDDHSVSQLIQTLVQSTDLSVFLADTKQRGLELYKQHSPEILILDALLPDGHGFELAEEVRIIESLRENYRSFIMFLTSLSSDEDLLKGLRSGGDLYLFKEALISEKWATSQYAILKAQIEVAKRNALLQKNLRKANDELHKIASTDGLTGIYNRRVFDIQFDYEWNKAEQEGNTISLILMDIDNFKKYNDTYGHQLWDECLKAVGSILQKISQFGESITTARYGGEEFTILISGINHTQTLAIAEYIRKQIEQLQIEHIGNVVPYVTTSIGAVTTSPLKGGKKADFFKRADAALYRAKDKGRNQVEWWEEEKK